MTLKERALFALEQRNKRLQAEEDERLRKEEEERQALLHKSAGELAALLRSVLDVEVCATNIYATPSFQQESAYYYEVEGIRFSVRYDLHNGSIPYLVAVRPCDCGGGEILSYGIRSLEDVGDWLQGGHVYQQHNCSAVYVSVEA